jgi:hypothetical protein
MRYLAIVVVGGLSGCQTLLGIEDPHGGDDVVESIDAEPPDGDPNDPCTGHVCDPPPAAYCSGSVATSFEAGVCSSTTGTAECAYREVETDCAAQGHVCNSGRCFDVGATCRDPVTGLNRAIVTPAQGDLTISEWMPDPTAVADNVGEWIELRVRAPLDLNGTQVGTAVIDSADCMPFATGSYVLLARNADEAVNGGLARVDALFGFTLGNTTGGFSLVGRDGTSLDSATYLSGVVAGRSFIKDGDVWCSAPPGTNRYNGVDYGTPRAVNTPACP